MYYYTQSINININMMLRGCLISILNREARGLSLLFPLSEAYDLDLSLTFQTASKTMGWISVKQP